MSLLSCSCLWGCKPKPATTVHAISDITAVAISCGEMDQSQSYSFWLHREDDLWLLDASCFTQQKEVETALTDCQITSEEIHAVFEILERNDSIVLSENQAKKATQGSRKTDGSVYRFVLTFSDGTQSTSASRQVELETFFYALAEKYADIVLRNQ